MAPRYGDGDNIPDPSPLAEPLRLEFSGRVAPNRFLKTAMSEYIASWVGPGRRAENGIPTDESITLYRHVGEGGFGIVVTGNILIDPQHIESPGNAIVPVDEPFSGARFTAFQELASAGKAGSSLFLGQLNHPGSQVTEALQPHPVSASDVHYQKSPRGIRYGKPRSASHDDIKALKAAFVHAAVFLERAGFDGIQLHGAHGYLIAQFLSQTTNRRTDEYGGSIENRARFVTELADEIRAATHPSFILGIKINSVEFQERGMTAADAARLVELLERHTFDFVELSGGNAQDGTWFQRRESTLAREAFFLEFAELITPHLRRTRSFVTGGLRSIRGMLGILATADGVGLGRPTCSEPQLPRLILAGKVSGALRPLVDELDFVITATLSGAQMRQLGRNEAPLDPSDPIAVEAFKKDADAWRGKFVKLKGDGSDGKTLGSMEIRSHPAVPYRSQSLLAEGASNEALEFQGSKAADQTQRRILSGRDPTHL